MLSRGDSGPAVRQWQERLNAWRGRQGLDAIAVDGIFGPITENATRQCQYDLAVVVDGVVGPGTQQALSSALESGADPRRHLPPLPGREGPVLRRGDTGDAVAEWQRRLNAWRDDLGMTAIAVDGIYGPVTADATRAFQASYDPLDVDGILGPRTRAVADHVLRGGGDPGG